MVLIELHTCQEPGKTINKLAEGFFVVVVVAVFNFLWIALHVEVRGQLCRVFSPAFTCFLGIEPRSSGLCGIPPNHRAGPWLEFLADVSAAWTATVLVAESASLPLLLLMDFHKLICRKGVGFPFTEPVPAS